MKTTWTVRVLCTFKNGRSRGDGSTETKTFEVDIPEGTHPDSFRYTAYEYAVRLYPDRVYSIGSVVRVK